MVRAIRPRTCLFLLLIVQLGIASSQVPSNYVPLEQANRPAQNNPNSVRASTYQEPQEPAGRQRKRASEQESLDTSQDMDTQEQGNASDQSLGGVKATANGLSLPGEAIIALGSDPVRAYTSEDYPNIARSAIQTVKDTQAQYTESLASQDIINILGQPFLQMAQGSGRCSDGGSGQYMAYYYLIRDSFVPKSMAVVRFCADGMQSITAQSLH